MPFAYYNRRSRCWKTSEATSLWDLTLSSVTLPIWGGMRDGVLYELPTPEPLTTERAYSSLPTPTAQTAKHGSTPDTTAHGFGSNLWDLPHLLPTPTVTDMGGSYTPEEWQAWKDKMKKRHGNSNGHGESLTQAAWQASENISEPSSGGSPLSGDEPPLPLWETEKDDLN